MGPLRSFTTSQEEPGISSPQNNICPCGVDTVSSTVMVLQKISAEALEKTQKIKAQEQENNPCAPLKKLTASPTRSQNLSSAEEIYAKIRGGI